ncbi:differentially expressed in FDCP 8 homolog isoform X2 [Chrysoperla carnea]|uniref:differentially expressed in FDCP 8 homolog isoform X2 n=1 Tax=Chrysoperla carnea TaxID=189513 RepID=UPI001D090462|nr:differentially expressed in FDCP 8 homolog isoform X2 [Chrysoperla carnea]
MESWCAAMAIPPSAEDCQVGIHSGCNTLASTPSSSTSGCTSADDSFDFRHIPTGLTTAECQLLLNSDATAVELESAITRLKELILDTEQCSDERKWVVRHLVELRLRLQERREADSDPQHPLNLSGGEIIRVTLGHHFKPQFAKPTTSSGKVYCDHCAKVVWSILQAWYICEDCGFISHYKCISEIFRVCAQVVAAEHPQYELNICPEQGLHLQQFRCAECRIAISLDVSWNEARLCDYNGKYYCPRCHWNTSMPTPARVIHNWDLEPKRVCQASAQLLRLTYKRPLLPLATLNSRLFGLVHELSVVRKQRDQLILMKRYLVNCRIAAEQHILSRLGDRLHMTEGCLSSDESSTNTGGVHLYSMQDLIETENGTLSKILYEIIEMFSKHIKKDCMICNGRGHLCELCNIEEILYPFDDGVHVCKVCGAVFHRACATMKHFKCSRCERRNRRKQKQEKPKEYICDGKCTDDCDCTLKLVNHPYTE